MKTRYPILFLVLLVALPCLASAYDIIRIKGPYENSSRLNTAREKPVPVNIEAITDTLADSVVGRVTSHQVGFQIPDHSVFPFGLYVNRVVVITFPDGFGLTGLTGVEYSDTDEETPDPVIDKVTVYSNSIVISFKNDSKVPRTGYFNYFTLIGIENAPEAGRYYVIVQIDSQLKQLIAGPDFSEPFMLLPREPSQLLVTPHNDTTLQAGDGILFTASIADEFGNPLETVDATWSLTPESAPIGEFSGPFFLATTPGVGRVMATAGDLVGYSGVISVRPGTVRSLEVEIADTQFVGHELLNTASITAYDGYGNRVTDFDQTGFNLSLTLNQGTLGSGTISPGEFSDGVADLSGRSFEGPAGEVLVEVAPTDAGIEIDPGHDEFFANGLVIEAPNSPADEVHEGWSFRFEGYFTNPGNIEPTAIYESFVLDDDVYLLQDFPLSCTPDPFNGIGCGFGPVLEASQPAGMYSYRGLFAANYVFEGNEITVTQQVDGAITILPFDGFSVAVDTLPSRALQFDYSDSGSFVLSGDVMFEDKVSLMADLYLVHEDRLVEPVLRYRTQLSGWSGQQQIDGPLLFRSDIYTGWVYDYALRLWISVIGDGEVLEQYTEVIGTDRTVEVFPRAVYKLDESSFSPAQAQTGTPTPITFDLISNGELPVVLDAENCFFTVTDGQTSVTATLTGDMIPLVTGTNELTTQPLTFVQELIGKDLLASLRLKGQEFAIAPVDTAAKAPFDIALTGGGAVQIVSLENDAPNAPFVNTKQVFTITGKLANLTDAALENVTVNLASNGASTFDPSQQLSEIPAGDTAEAVFTVTAGTLPNPSEQFTISVAGPTGGFVIKPLDDVTSAVIQTPAQLELEVGVADRDEDIVVLDFGEVFEIAARLKNSGQAAFSGGTAVIEYSGDGDFGLEFPDEREFVDGELAWPLTAPNEDLMVEFEIRIEDPPLDLNTGLPADIIVGQSSVPVVVRKSETSLRVRTENVSTKPIESGTQAIIFDLTIENVTNDNRNVIGLNSIKVAFEDKNGILLDPTEIVDPENSAFLIDGVPVTTVRLQDLKLYHDFSNVFIPPGVKIRLAYALTVRGETDLKYFALVIEEGAIDAEIVEGPHAGEHVPAVGAVDEAFSVTVPSPIIPTDLSESFANYPNPFNPLTELTLIRYYLPEATNTRLAVYTATGEEVIVFTFNAGEAGASSGANEVAWDGRNEEGDVVLNGVYIAVINAGGAQAKLKMAVVK